ncbi:NAD(P)-dependent dehydrogenase (short-subunit alcohol dehydrogenase family) [Luteibacter sp. Sphag1AF]|uniref:SDR family oxidoreductase n=1 Tax=Luteibacter sp. Sphag1AF TaxID=2587031 RepID=UPI001610D0FA|nr:SDR family oxidoreductase [Luteibacter sp. Sphag1AF]MBB3226593.1 NAD(P)-dependent dehydrogenase (short-subunit alcohol dehydrogenase family) [Luteibacter sp. Sphag1AF]
MNIKGSVALVTGANRGLGLAFAKALLAAGATKVYAGARNPASVPGDVGLTPVQLDVTDPASVAAAAAALGDVQIVINNAGISGHGSGLASDNGERALRDVFETNFYGVQRVAQAFAPILARNGGGALVNMLSALSWTHVPGIPAYSVSKAAAWSLTNALRHELRDQGTLVVAVHAGYIDTDMVRAVDAPKVSPEEVALRTVEGIAAGTEEVLADDTARAVKAGLNANPAVYLAPFA